MYRKCIRTNGGFSISLAYWKTTKTSFGGKAWNTTSLSSFQEMAKLGVNVQKAGSSALEQTINVTSGKLENDILQADTTELIMVRLEHVGTERLKTLDWCVKTSMCTQWWNLFLFRQRNPTLPHHLMGKYNVITHRYPMNTVFTIHRPCITIPRFDWHLLVHIIRSSSWFLPWLQCLPLWLSTWFGLWVWPTIGVSYLQQCLGMSILDRNLGVGKL